MKKRKKLYIKTVSLTLIFALLAALGGAAALQVRAANANEAVIFEYLTGPVELNTAAACGVLANLEWESGFDPHAVGDGGTSYGICQWHASRFARLRDYCAENGLDYTALEGQLEYLRYELENYYPRVLEYLRGVSDDAEGAYDAGYYWCYHFEIPAGYASGVSVKRGNLAKNTYYPAYYTPEPTLSEAQKLAAAAQESGAFQRICTRLAKAIRTVVSMLSGKRG